ncbi:B9 domain-containing protein 1-like [Teleopsis dalmanni]|uniref:B9 domain-containing protein 1-like n=2 Tax=Teleopsis dalmanni TaxID=139649 RepID=UPI0018CE2E9D|nr:B9 domain-containing protein 1-like [Teleopsis dalmanni]
MESPTTASTINIFISGQLESAIFPMGPDADEIFCRYEVVAGADWELVSGCQNGITQTASNKCGHYNDKIVLNMPIEITFKSTSPHGWPQIIVIIYGKTRWGVETVLGYSRAHVPIFGSNSARRITAPILIPKCTNLVSQMTSWITGKNPELKNPRILLDANINGLAVESYGEIILMFNVISRGANQLGYDWG